MVLQGKEGHIVQTELFAQTVLLFGWVVICLGGSPLHDLGALDIDVIFGNSERWCIQSCNMMERRLERTPTGAALLSMPSMPLHPCR